jgi:uncharacterized membrane protein YhaH (DUF805 family)
MNDPRGGQGGPALLVLLALLLIGLYGKLVIHRLHDLGLSVRWFLLLGPLLIGLPILMYRESNDVYLRIEQSYVAQQAVQGYVLFMLVGSFALFIGGFVVLGCVPGTNGPNRYGPDPRKRAERSA